MNNNEPKKEQTDPSVSSVYQHLVYGLSLPERAIRTTAATVGGVIHESATLLVPQAFRDSKTYNVFVHQMIDMLAKDVGGVERPLSLIHISEPTRPERISYAVFCL